jgi:hypothetical protein
MKRHGKKPVGKEQDVEKKSGIFAVSSTESTLTLHVCSLANLKLDRPATAVMCQQMHIATVTAAEP